jgi:hypothetical protein
MKRGFSIAVVVAGCWLSASGVWAQAPASGDGAQSTQNKPPSNAQKPAAGPAPSPAPSGGNPFPEDTATIPVMPNATSTPGTVPDADSGGAGVAVPATDTDPARSPDDGAGNVPAPGSESSSSYKDLEKLLPNPDEEVNSKRNKKEPTHEESAANDINVGKYYLEARDWHAALSRFQSAMVLDPEDPEAYWGMAVAEHHLGDFASAKAYYQKLLDYDPDGPHGKAARKAMKEPEIANAQNAAHGQPAPAPPK